MDTVSSKDGTTIAFDKFGQGPALILVPGAFEQRAMESETANLAALSLLGQHFTVFHYDRRGRGDSTDTLPFALEREIEDIEALIDAGDGSAFLFGISSGAGLAFEAALALPGKVTKLAMYEVPYNDDPSARAAWVDFRKQLTEVLAEGRRGDAVGLFMMLLGMPPEHLEGMRQHPMWPMFEAVAPTLAYDAAALGDDASVPRAGSPARGSPAIMDGGATEWPFMTSPPWPSRTPSPVRGTAPWWPDPRGRRAQSPRANRVLRRLTRCSLSFRRSPFAVLRVNP
jgi:pimeloyl-ACP methyl ester carboxylesterase